LIVKFVLIVFYSVLAGTLAVGAPILWFWGEPGRTFTNLVSAWCRFLGVADPVSVQVSTGVVAGLLLALPILYLWRGIVAFTMDYLADLDRRHQARRK
jgi:hypothetical protein